MEIIYERLIVVLTTLTLIVAIAAFEGRDIVLDEILGGDIIPLPPTGYGVIREFSDLKNQPDAIILPLELYNSWRQEKEFIRSPYLILNKKDSNQTYKFYLVGEYPDISLSFLKNDFVYMQTFVMLPSEYSERILVFQIDPQINQSTFHFSRGDTYTVNIGFQRWHRGAFKQEKETQLFVMTIPDSINNANKWEVGADRWIYFDLKNTSNMTTTQQFQRPYAPDHRQ